MKSSGLGWVAFGILAVVVLFSQMFKPSKEGAPVIQEGGSPVAVASPSPASSDAAKPPIVGRGSSMTGRDAQGNTTWVLHASSLTLRDSDKKASAKDVECTFFGKDKKPVATLVAAGALMDTKTMDLDFEGEVETTTPLGEKMTVKVLRYDGKKKKFLGHGGVRLTRATSVLTGDELIADPAMKIVTIKGNVRADIRTLAVATPSGSPSAGTVGR